MLKYTPKDSNPIVEKFINYIMKDGKKELARRLFDQTLIQMKTKGEKDPMNTFETAIDNIMPEVEVRPKRVGGGVYQVPIEVKANRRIALSFRWILEAARSHKNSSFYSALSSEIIAASTKNGTAFKRKEDVQRMAKANKAFAHLARF